MNQERVKDITGRACRNRSSKVQWKGADWGEIRTISTHRGGLSARAGKSFRFRDLQCGFTHVQSVNWKRPNDACRVGSCSAANLRIQADRRRTHYLKFENGREPVPGGTFVLRDRTDGEADRKGERRRIAGPTPRRGPDRRQSALAPEADLSGDGGADTMRGRSDGDPRGAAREQAPVFFHRVVQRLREPADADGSAVHAPGRRPGADLTLAPGILVEVHIRIADRSPLSYLTKPLTDYFSRSLREE